MTILLIPLPFLLWALYTDLRMRKIRNAVTYPLILIGLVVQLQGNGLIGLAGCLAGLCVYGLLSARLRTMRIGGGDMKLVVGCLMFMDIRTSETFILMLFFVSALLGIFQYARRDGLWSLMQLLKADILTAGRAPWESVHVTGGLVIITAYGISAVLTAGIG